MKHKFHNDICWGQLYCLKTSKHSSRKQFQPQFLFSSETSTVPKWLFPFAQAVCAKSAVSSFAAIWRPKSFTFSRGTAVGPELTCIVPDFPDVSVQIPLSCVPVNQDFSVTIKVHGTKKFYTCMSPATFSLSSFESFKIGVRGL